MKRELKNKKANEKAAEFGYFYYNALGTVYDSLLAFRAITTNTEAFLQIPNAVTKSGDKDLIRKYDHVFSFQRTAGDLNSIYYVTSGPDIFFRSLPGEQNERYIVNMLIVHVFQMWENTYRPAIASLLEIKPTDLKIPIMGDICKIRNSILHNDGVANEDCNRCEVIKDFKQGDKIIMTSEILWRIKEAIAEAMFIIGCERELSTTL